MNTSYGDISSEITAFYESNDEKNRLLKIRGQLEFERTKEILNRFLPHPPAVVLDVGGGAGIYSCWLAREGYEAHLVEPVEKLLEQAREASQKQPKYPISSFSLSDARTLKFGDEFADAVLLFGPLYHLQSRQARLGVLREAHRVLRHQSFLFAVGISRFSFFLNGLLKGFIADQEFFRIVEQELLDGQHHNPIHKKEYFTEAYFHHPQELKHEIEEAGFFHEATLAVEGPAWIFHNLADYWNNGECRKRLLKLTKAIEQDVTILGASDHIMEIGKK